jgi:hypothetical protein
LALQRADQGEGFLSHVVVVTVPGFALLSRDSQMLMAIVIYQPPLLMPAPMLILHLVLPMSNKEVPQASMHLS